MINFVDMTIIVLNVLSIVYHFGRAVCVFNTSSTCHRVIWMGIIILYILDDSCGSARKKKYPPIVSGSKVA